MMTKNGAEKKTKKMTKSVTRMISLLLALMMVVSLFSGSSIAATGTDAENAAKCAELGLLQGSGNGLTDAYLASEMTRLQSAIIFVRLLKLEDEALAYAGGGNFPDVNETTVPWDGGRNILSFVHDNPDLGYIGFTDGTFRPNNIMKTESFLKVLLSAIDYEQDVDFVWSEIKQTVTNLEITALNNQFGENMIMQDVANAFIDALDALINHSDLTLADRLGITLEDVNTNNNQATNLTYDFTAYQNKADIYEYFTRSIALDLMRGPYNYKVFGDKTPEEFYTTVRDVTIVSNEWLKVYVSAFLISEGYLDGKIDAVDDKDWYNDYIQWHRDQKFEVVQLYLNTLTSAVMSDYQQKMFEYNITENFTLVTEAFTMNVTPALPPVTVDLLEYAARQSNGTQTTLGSDYVIYADKDSNTYVVTQGKNIISSDIIILDGSNILGANGQRNGSDLPALYNLSSSIQSKASIVVYSSKVLE